LITAIEPYIIQEGYDRKTCWVQSRAGVFPDGQAVLTTQKLLLTGSDIFYGLHSRHSQDSGLSWSPLTAQAGLNRRPYGDGLVICPCDGTPAWHKASQTMLLTGHTAVYRDDTLARPYQHFTFYSTYEPATRCWAEWRTLDLPDATGLLASCGAGCTQRFDLPDGDILLPVYGPGQPPAPDCAVVILRCGFDGKTLTFKEAGQPLCLTGGRGFVEPSVTAYSGRFFLTLRNDSKGYVASSEDGLHYSTPKPWCWEDGTEIGNYNTQQHWLVGGGDLYLVYTRRGAGNDHIFRHRAPLFIAQVDPERLCLLRTTERVAVPEKGARLGNFGITRVSDSESWVVVSEWMQTTAPNPYDYTVCEKYGANNRIWRSRILF